MSPTHLPAPAPRYRPRLSRLAGHLRGMSREAGHSAQNRYRSATATSLVVFPISMSPRALDICEAVASIRHPIPSPDELLSSVSAPDSATALDAAESIREQSAQERQDLAESLRAAWHEANIDPLLSQIEEARSRISAADSDLRRLLAYGRLFTHPAPYGLELLARHAGMSPSGASTAYGEADIDFVAKNTGLTPRQRPTRTRQSAGPAAQGS